MKAAIRCIISENPRFPSQTALAKPGNRVLNSTKRKDARPFFTKRIERLSSPERWFTAILFAFKLFATAMIIVPIIWHMTLPQHHSSSWGDFDQNWYWAVHDFAIAANVMGGLCLLVAVVIVIGGLIQLLRYSPRRGAWSIAFGGIALAAGIFLAFYFSQASFDLFQSQTLT